MARTHDFPDDRVPYTWDAGIEPGLTIESGDTVRLETRDVSDGQIGVVGALLPDAVFAPELR